MCKPIVRQICLTVLALACSVSLYAQSVRVTLDMQDAQLKDVIASVEGQTRYLFAADEDVDSCWINFLDPEKLAAELGLPENEEVLMVMDLGYAAEGAGPLPNHENRKALSETVSCL